MQDKQGRMLTWMAGCLVVLVGVVVLGEQNGDTLEEEDEIWTAAFPDVERSQVTALHIEGTAYTLTLIRADDGWQMTTPIKAAADSDRIQGLLGTLEDLECGDDLEASSPADFGLAPPTWTVRLTASETEHTLRVGTESPVGGRTYVQCADDAVRTTRQRLTDALSESPDDFRSRAIAAFPISALTGLRVTLPVVTAQLPLEEARTETLIAQRTAAGWRDEQSGALLDDEKLLMMAEAMTGAQVEGFDVEPPTPPLIRIEAIADGVTHTIEYGINGTARVPLQDAPVTLSGEFPVPGQLDALLSSALMPVDPVTLSEIHLSLGEQSISANRDSNGWTQPAAEGILAAIQDVRVDRRMPAPEATGAPYGEVRLLDAEGLAVSVALHQEVDGQRVVVDAAGGPNFLLPATELSRLVEALTL